MMIKSVLKNVVKFWPWPLTRNEAYDRQTKAVIQRICDIDSVCIDVGAYKGEILKLMMNYAPHAKHIAFEPIPEQYEWLAKEWGDKATIYPFALGKENIDSSFNLVVSNPTYSGLRKRKYKRREEIREIRVQVRRLDDIISSDIPIRLIKIDVEGGEFDVLDGAKNTLSRWKPMIIFEHGVGGADNYGILPTQLFQLLTNELGYRICLMKDFLKDKDHPGFSQMQFEEQFWSGKNCYFMAVPQ